MKTNYILKNEIKKMNLKTNSSKTSKKSNKKLGFSCCFCNNSIMSLDLYPADINIVVNIDKSKEQQFDQFFFCHTECFKDKLHEKIKSHFNLHDINN